MTVVKGSHELIFTLVHGTWGRGFFPRYSRSPRWFEGGSIFYEQLTRPLDEKRQRYKVKSFHWSGANSVFARDIAAKELAKELVVQCEESPNAQQIIVAHSHGGNVALRALHYLDQDGTIINPIWVATLAAPFLQIYEVSPNSPRSYVYAKVGFVLGALLSGFVAGWLNIENMAARGFLGFLVMLVPFVVIQLLLGPWQRSGVDIANKANALAAAAKYSINERHRSHILVLRGIDDEASFALGIGLFGASMGHLILSVFGRLGWWLAGGAGIGSFSVSLWVNSNLRLSPDGLPMLVEVGFVLICAMGIMLVCLFLIPVFKSVFGREMAFGAARCDIAVNSSPDARDNIQVVTLPQSATSEGFVRHKIYQHEACAPAIVNWVLKLAPWSDADPAQRA